MAFPQTILDLRADLNLAGTWTDITSFAYQRQSPAVSITRGRQDEVSQIGAASAAFQLNNRDGRFTPRNALGPYFGKLGRNTPVRFSVPASGAFLRLEGDQASYASCPSSASLNLAGDLDARLAVTVTDWQPTVLAAKWAASAGNFSWAWLLNADGTMSLQFTTDGSTVQTVTSAVAVPLPVGAVVWRVTRVAATGAVAFYYGTTVGASFTQIGAAVTGATGALFAGTAALAVGYSAYHAGLTGYSAGLVPLAYGGLNGQVTEFRLYSGIGGTLVADPVFSAQAPGAASFADAQANTWSMGGTAEISDRDYRFHGEMSALPQRWDASGTDVWTPVAAGGLLRRLGQAAPPLDSAMRRAVGAMTGASRPVSYWPGEDPQGSAQIASGLESGSPMTWAGPAQLAGDSGVACSSPLPGMNGATFTAPVARYAGNTVCVRFLLHVAAGSTTPSDVDICWIPLPNQGPPSIAALTVLYQGTALEAVGFDAAGTAQLDTGSVTIPGGIAGQVLYVSIEASYSGGTGKLTLNVIPAGSSVVTTATNTLASATTLIRPPTAIQFNAGLFGVGLFTDGSSFGHVSVHAAVPPMAPFTGPVAAWTGEPAGCRYARLCGEQGIGARIIGPAAVSAAMGPQLPQTLTTLLQECEDADRGLMFEPRQAYGIGYRTLVSLLNQPPAVTLDYASAQLAGDLQPVDDDQYTRNDVTVSRTGGSSATQTLADGSAMSISPPPAGAGDYADAKSVNVQYDLQLPDVAGWLVHVGTVDEQRYPQITVNMARSQVAGVFYAVPAVDIGGYVAISNPPAWLPPGTIRQVVTGATEQLGGYTYVISWNTVPESPYETGVLDDPVYGHADTDGCTLGGPVPSGALGNQLSNPGFESGSVSPWFMSGGTIALDAAHAHSGSDGLAVTPDGVTGFPHAGSERVAASPGQVWSAQVWALASAGLAHQVAVVLNWYNSGGSLLSSTTGTLTTLSTSAWTRLAVSGAAPANTAAVACVFAVESATVAASEVSYWDDAVLAPVLQAVSSGLPWTPHAADYPFNVMAGGEQMTVWGAPGLYRESFEAGTGGWFGSAGTIAQSTGWASDGTHSLQFTASGDFAHAGGPSVFCMPGDIVSAAVDLMAGTAVTAAQVVINWRNSAGSIIATTVSPAVSLTAGQEITLEADGTAPAGTVFFSVQFGMASAGVAGQVLYGDNARAVQGGTPVSPQALSVVRSVNGVVKAHTAGEDIRLAHPLILAIQ